MERNRPDLEPKTVSPPMMMQGNFVGCLHEFSSIMWIQIQGSGLTPDVAPAQNKMEIRTH